MAFYEVLKALSTALAPNQGAGLSACNLPVAAALQGPLDIIGQQQDNSGNRVSWLILSSCFPNKFGFGEVAVPSDWDRLDVSLCSHLLFSSSMQPHCLYCSAWASEGKHDEVCEAGSNEWVSLQSWRTALQHSPWFALETHPTLPCGHPLVLLLFPICFSTFLHVCCSAKPALCLGC